MSKQFEDSGDDPSKEVYSADNQMVSLVIPCYNEEKRIDLLVSALRVFDKAWPNAYEVIVVDDGSSDATYAMLKRAVPPATSKAKEVIVYQLPQNEGKGGALAAGIMRDKGDFVLTLDADMAAEPTELLDWLSQMPNGVFDKNVVLIGSRQHSKSKIEAKPLRRVLGNVYNLVIKTFTPIQERDTQCGFKLYPRQVAQVVFKDLKIKGWAHDIEVLYKAHLMGAPIRSLPIKWKHVDNEKISVFKDGLVMAWQTIYVSLLIRFDRKTTRHLKAMKSKI